MSPTDAAVRSRAKGRADVEAKTVWQLQAGIMSARCIKVKNGFEVQFRTSKGWTETFSGGPDPVELLRQVTCSASLAHVVALRAGAL